MLLEKALSQYGIREIKGSKHNPEVLKYFRTVGKVYSDETAWCSAFMNWCANEVGLGISGQLNARSWLDVGNEIAHPDPGNDIVIFWRDNPKSWKGHVGIFINIIGDSVNVLGGNQNNMVCIKPYPKSRVLSYRRLS